MRPLLQVVHTQRPQNPDHRCQCIAAWRYHCNAFPPPPKCLPQVNSDYLAKAQDALCTVHAVNKTDVVTLLSTFGSVAAIAEASMEEMAQCPGLGDKKVLSLYDALHKPFFTGGGGDDGGGGGGGGGVDGKVASKGSDGGGDDVPADDEMADSVSMASGGGGSVGADNVVSIDDSDDDGSNEDSAG